jgi:hypothetical protein
LLSSVRTSVFVATERECLGAKFGSHNCLLEEVTAQDARQQEPENVCDNQPEM